MDYVNQVDPADINWEGMKEWDRVFCLGWDKGFVAGKDKERLNLLAASDAELAELRKASGVEQHEAA